jgi:hypothetical protein
VPLTLPGLTPPASTKATRRVPPKTTQPKV